MTEPETHPSMTEPDTHPSGCFLLSLLSATLIALVAMRLTGLARMSWWYVATALYLAVLAVLIMALSMERDDKR